MAYPIDEACDAPQRQQTKQNHVDQQMLGVSHGG
jgi:hypothetical protein